MERNPSYANFVQGLLDGGAGTNIQHQHYVQVSVVPKRPKYVIATSKYEEQDIMSHT